VPGRPVLLASQTQAETAAKARVLSRLHGWALVRADSLAEGSGFEPSVLALEPVRAEPTQRVTHLTYAVRER